METITVKPEDMTQLGENLQVARIGNSLVFIVPDLNVDLGMSVSGKSRAISQTGGMARLTGLMINIWVGRKL
jgi:hypothetical protein